MDKSHEARGYDEGHYGSHIAYHFLVGSDGTVKQNRSLNERSGHTRNDITNNASIAIALAGNFDVEQPTEKQLNALRGLVKTLDDQYHFEKIMGHRHVPGSPTACPGKNLMALDLWRDPTSPETFQISRYYTPVPGQPRYYRNTYEEDFKVNCQGDCLVTADGYRLKPEDAYKIAACPPHLPIGTKIKLDGIGIVTCRDRGSAIQGNKLDIWTGEGNIGLDNILNRKFGAGAVSGTILD